MSIYKEDYETLIVKDDGGDSLEIFLYKDGKLEITVTHDWDNRGCIVISKEEVKKLVDYIGSV